MSPRKPHAVLEQEEDDNRMTQTKSVRKGRNTTKEICVLFTMEGIHVSTYTLTFRQA